MKKLIKLTVLCLMSMLALAVVTACKPKHEITGIEIKDKPTKEWYYVDDAAGLQLAGGMITVKYADNVNEEIEMTDAEVAVTGFDSSAPNASLKLTVTYKNKTASFNVEIKVDPVTGVAVSSTGFKSLYFTGEALSVNTVKITYESGKTDDMAFDSAKMTVSGYNATLVQEQTVTLTYEGKLCTFKVKVIGEDKITPLLAKIEELEKLDWTSGIPEANAATMEIANDAFDIYAGLNADYRTFITLTQMRPAIALVFMPYYKEYERLKNAILLENKYIDDDDGLIISDITTLQDFSKLVKDITALIGEMKDKFTAYALSEIEKDHRLGSDYLTPAVNWLAQKGGMLNSYADSITAAVNALEILKDLPNPYPENLLPYDEDLLDACEFIFAGTGALKEIFAVTGLVRDDLIDLLYHYFIYYYSDEDVVDKITALTTVYIPELLEEIKFTIYYMFNEYFDLYYDEIYDTTIFMLYHREVLRLIDEMYDSNDVISMVIYQYVKFDDFLTTSAGPYAITLSELFYWAETDYYQNGMSYYWWMDRMLGDRIFEGFFDNYLDVAYKFLTSETYFGSAEFLGDVEALLERFLNLSPVHQFQFFIAIDSYYKLAFVTGDVDPYYIVSELTGGELVFFEMLYYYHYYNGSTNAQWNLFVQLMYALEQYALCQSGRIASSYFLTQMGTCTAAYAAVQPAADSMLGQFYTKYSVIYQIYTTTNYPFVLGEWENDFEQLATYLKEMEFACYYTYNQGYPYHMFFFTSYFNAIKIAERILTDAPDEIVNAYYNYNCYQSGSSSRSIGYMMYACQNYYVYFMKWDYELYNYGLDLWDFLTPELEDFIALSYHGYWGYMNDEQIYDDDIMKLIITQFRELSEEDQYNFLFMFDSWFGYIVYDENYSYYYYVMYEYYGLVFGDESDELEIAMALFDAENYYVSYAIDENEDALQDFLDQMKECIDLYEDLDDTTDFDSYLWEMYEYYRDKYEELKGDESVTPETPEEEVLAA